MLIEIHIQILCETQIPVSKYNSILDNSKQTKVMKKENIWLLVCPSTPPLWSGKISINFPWKKGTPCSLRISLLDSRFLEYQNAVIGTVQITLNAGTIFVTLFPNFNMSLKDPHLCDALKVQVQITGASQV